MDSRYNLRRKVKAKSARKVHVPQWSEHGFHQAITRGFTIVKEDPNNLQCPMFSFMIPKK